MPLADNVLWGLLVASLRSRSSKCLTLVLLMMPTARASLDLTFDGLFGLGSMSFDGGNSPLVGSRIDVGCGIPTSFSPCHLDFTTGSFVDDSNGAWNFGA